MYHLPLSAAAESTEMLSHAAELWTGCNFGCVYCLPFAKLWAEKSKSCVPDGWGIAETTVRRRA
jgi:hypothetical protein